ncbi:hypothetical protein, partial [Nocardia farcinica]|uniref:hypothetical protein n=1 Tax=Nocardia farcinica TaxID=37329 RepID=UPI002454DA06
MQAHAGRPVGVRGRGLRRPRQGGGGGGGRGRGGGGGGGGGAPRRAPSNLSGLCDVALQPAIDAALRGIDVPKVLADA